MAAKAARPIAGPIGIDAELLVHRPVLIGTDPVERENYSVCHVPSPACQRTAPGPMVDALDVAGIGRGLRSQRPSSAGDCHPLPADSDGWRGIATTYARTTRPSARPTRATPSAPRAVGPGRPPRYTSPP